MTTHAKGTFSIQSWDENPYVERDDGQKLTRADVAQSFEGDIQGEGSVVYLMNYAGDTDATYVGLQHIAGTVGGRKGSVVLQLTGAFDGAEAKGAWSVVPGSGTGDLAGLSGEGGFTAPLGGTPEYTLDYDLG